MAAVFERKTPIAVTGAVLVLWFALNLILNLLKVFGSTTPDLYVYFAILVPAALLVASYVGVAGFRRFLLSIDLRLLTIVQCWRVVGAAFFFLYAFNVLPRAWAFPAAFGDIAIGVTAPVFAMALIKGKSFPRRAFIVWNLLGILDFVVAAFLGLAVGELVGIRSGEISIAPMTVLPLVLFPTFIVPFFLLVHLITLVQVAARVEFSR